MVGRCQMSKVLGMVFLVVETCQGLRNEANLGSSLGVPSHFFLKNGAKKARSPVTITSETNGLFFTAVLSPVISPGVFNPLFPYQSGPPPKKKQIVYKQREKYNSSKTPFSRGNLL